MTDLSMLYSKVNDLWLLYTPIYYSSPLVFSVAKTHNDKIAKWLLGYSSYNVFLNGVNDVFYIIIADVWACRQTHTNLE